MSQTLKHCGLCRELGHSARTCNGALEPSRARAKEVLDNLFGREREREQKNEGERAYRPATPREIFASRGPRYRGESYVNPYPFKPSTPIMPEAVAA